MLYIGKFINNFKDFYNEINSATLTGAIDVVVIRQPDGSYRCSPFHVRFGKIGVLRSREKVVDIEVNGKPVDIHMKLGESGEAFFVEEVDIEKEIPAYLATSPLPDTPDIEAELHKMKLAAGSDKTIIPIKNTENFPDKIQPSIDPATLIPSDQTTVLPPPVLPSPNTDCDTTTSSTNITERNNEVATSEVPFEREFEIPEPRDVSNSIHTDSSEEFKTKRKRRKKTTTKKRTKAKELQIPSSKSKVVIDQQVISRNSNAVDDLEDKPEEIFQMDDDYGEGEDDEGYPSSSGGLSRSISLPVSSNINNLLGSEWPTRKMSSTFTGEFHPFSDGDVTPQSSPVGSRPPSPKSDTEYEIKKIDNTCAADTSTVSWGWGQLPNVPRKFSDTQLPNNANMDGPSCSNDGKEEENADAEKRSMLGGMLNFMRSTKKMRHMPESEGIYLSEINADELDPELAALYFPKFKSCGPQPENLIKDEDAESGKGPSLPHSPHTVDGSYESPHSQDSDSDDRLSLDHFGKEKCESISYPYSDIAMSLCGGLQDLETDLPEERFLHSLVTFDEFTENPAILLDPNLVIRIGGKYYNWSTAASMLASIIMFQRPLPETTTNRLINEHMPKKKKSKSYSSWWSWRRSEAENKTETETTPMHSLTNSSVDDTSEVKSEPLSEIKPEPSVETKPEPLAETKPEPLSEPKPEPPAETKLEPLPETKPVEQMICDKDCAPATTEATLKSVIATEPLTSSEQIVPTTVDSQPEEQLEEVIVDSPLGGTPVAESDEMATPLSSSTGSMPINILSSESLEEEPSNLSPETVAQVPDIVKEQTLDSDSTYRKEKYQKSLRLTSKQIVNLNLNEGPNEVVFSVTTAYQGTTRCTCHIFLWNYDDKIVISDIDGTITKSDVLGHILPMVGHNWAQLGVAKLFTKVKSNGYQFLYLSARAIGQARITREYLRSVRQGEIFLPDGPLLLSPTSLISALHREVIEKKPEEFKISCLKDIQTLFPKCMGNPFYAGFGNKINDTWAYRAVGIPITRVFTINHRGELKLELIQTFQSSYTRLSDEVDHVFPPMKPCITVNGHPTPIFSSSEEFSYFTYWREPVPVIDEDDMEF